MNAPEKSKINQTRSGAAAINGKERFCPEYYTELSSLEEDHFWFQARCELVLYAARRFFSNAAKVLDIGCGTGLITGRLRELSSSGIVVGADCFPESLEAASRSLGKDALVLAEVESLPFAGAFDLICLLDVLEHVEDDEAALREVALALRPCGGVLITVPQHTWLWSRQDEHSHHQRRYSASDLMAKLRKGGFQILFRTSFVSILLPLMFLVRMFRGICESSRLTGGRQDPMAELRISGSVNKLLKHIMALEVSAIRGGICFPFGGSLLVAAKKHGDRRMG